MQPDGDKRRKVDEPDVSSVIVAASAAEEPDAGQAKFFTRLQIVPYGVLGIQMTLQKDSEGRPVEVRRAPPPSSATAFVDAAGLHHVHGEKGPQGANGSAGAIYKHIGIYESTEFPADVREHVTKEGDARLYRYSSEHGDQNVIHAIGPDFRKDPYATGDTQAQSIEMLSKAHCSVLAEYAAVQLSAEQSPIEHLRLLPLSGGIFSGRYAKDIPDMTMEALAEGFAQLSAEQQALVLGAKSLELCIFAEKELDSFKTALAEAQQQQASVASSQVAEVSRALESLEGPAVSDEKRRYIDNTLNPVMQELMIECLRAMPENPEAFMLQLLEKKAAGQRSEC